MTAIPGADELRMRSILRTKGVGPDALPTPPPPVRPKDWLDDILDGNAPDPAPDPDEPADDAADEPDPAPAQPQPPATPAAKTPAAKSKKQKKRRPRDPHAPRAAFDTRPEDPRQSLLDAYDRIPHRIRWLTYHATAAGAGWRLGWVTWATDTAAWLPAGHWTTPSAFVLYGLGLCTVALYRRTRSWLWLAAWAAAIPVSSIVVGVLLYGTGYHH